MTTTNRLRDEAVMRLPCLDSVHVVVVGDVMLDRYWLGSARRVSQEAPVPVVDVSSADDRPGGAANVALNVASLGARCTLIGMVGDDEAAFTLETMLAAAGVNCHLIRVENWATILKLRVVSQKQQLLRIDFERPTPADVGEPIKMRLQENLPDATAVVLQDYDKGAIDDPQALIKLSTAAGVPVVVDPKHKQFACYSGADLIKPNIDEFRMAVGQCLDEDAVVTSARETCIRHRLKALVITRGDRGMTVVEHNGMHQHIPAKSADVYDVTGAGDTAAAALGVTRSLGWDPIRCAQLANIASGIVVGKSGTATVSAPEIVAAAHDRPSRGILDRSRLLDTVIQARERGERIVFTNGCFDILHAGHVAYLEKARSLGDRLVVAVNDDDSTRRLKGPGRPVNPLARRLLVLSGLSAVDWVVDFADDTPEALLRDLQPDVLAKGGGYVETGVIDAEIVRAYGGDVRVLSLLGDVSTTAIVARIQATR